MAYVYVHKKLDGSVFYVGIGDAPEYKRAFSKHDRNGGWHFIARRGYTVVIIHDNISRDEACVIEVDMIAAYGRLDQRTGTLTNRRCGGTGERPDYMKLKKIA